MLGQSIKERGADKEAETICQTYYKKKETCGGEILTQPG